METEALLTYS